ncbi:hypothetical protein [Cryptosporangium japonicum]|uniref:Uncharacterized protein n=1 Tax=Cryptosporangium japonicum TaxID=80872 RepID=A0ABP3EWE6_9ACTN
MNASGEQDPPAERHAELERQNLLHAEPPPPTTTTELIDRAAAITAPIVAVEGRWDGDTHGWFVVLVAIVERPGRHHDRFDEEPLTLVRGGGDLRLFNGHAPPWPEARRATEQGHAVARSLDVPFHFTSPDTPDDDAPRWWDLHP